MCKILDIHTHHPAPQPQAVVSVNPSDFSPIDGQLYSVGIHPWDTLSDIPDELWDALYKAARHPQVVAIGECGIDLVKGGPLYRQMLVMKRQAELADELGKPLVVHCVHAHDIIIGMKKDIMPKVEWAVHGFRGKPTVARMLSDAGFWLSFNDRYNPDSVPVVPLDRLLVETDDSPCTVGEVITALSCLRGEDLTETAARNAARFLSLPAYPAGPLP